MIGQILPRGSGVRGLLHYLFTEGLAGDKGLESGHTDAWIVACWDGHPQNLQLPVGLIGNRDFTELAGRLEEPVAALGYSRQELRTIKPVHHLAIAAAKDPGTGAPVERTLSDAEWAEIAQDYMHRIGPARRDDDLGVRWVAVRHAKDHVHVVATLARQDGRRPRLDNDRHRSGRRASLSSASTGWSRRPRAAGLRRRPAVAVGWLLLSAQVAQPSGIKQLLTLMAQLAALSDAVTRLREAQDRAGQVHHRGERLLLALVANRTVDPCLELAAAR